MSRPASIGRAEQLLTVTPQDFEHIVNTLVKWTREYKARTGFDGPGAFITYFVDRNGRKKWPQLNYGGNSGARTAGRPQHPLFCLYGRKARRCMICPMNHGSCVTVLIRLSA